MNDPALKQEYAVWLDGEGRRHRELVHRGLDGVGVVGIVDDGDDGADARTLRDELHDGPGWTVRLEARNILLGADEPLCKLRR